MTGHKNNARGNKKCRGLTFAGCAVLAGAALGVVLWPFCCAPAAREAVQSCRALPRRDSEGLPSTHAIKPFQVSSQKPSVVCGAGIYRSFPTGISLVSSFVPSVVI